MATEDQVQRAGRAAPADGVPRGSGPASEEQAQRAGRAAPADGVPRGSGPAPEEQVQRGRRAAPADGVRRGSGPAPEEQVQRRRGAELEAELLVAAWAELAEVGYARLTMEGVAARAKTGKQVLYRRWKNRAQLVIAAMRHNTGSIVDDIPDTGSLRTDVLGILDRMARRFRDIGPEIAHGLMAEAPDLDPAQFTIMGEVMETLVARAAARGEIPTATLPPTVLTAPINLLRHEMLLTTHAISPTTLTSLVDDVFLPLATHHLNPRRPL